MDVQTFNGYEINIKEIRQSNYDIIIADFVINDDMGDKVIFSFEQLPLINEISDLVLEIAKKQIENTVKKYPEEFKTFGKTLGY